MPRKKYMLQTDKRRKEHWTVSVKRKPSQKRSDVESGYPGPGINGGATRDLYTKPHMTLEPTDFIDLMTTLYSLLKHLAMLLILKYMYCSEK